MKPSENILNFAMTGAAGYVAPRHMKAIRETGNNLTAVLDPFDSIGIIDSYFPEADFFTESERFDRHLDKLRRRGQRKIDYVSICSPNYLHDAHIRLALRNGSDAICEKPLVLNPWNVDALQEIEKETGQKINVILQLRLHPAIREIKKRMQSSEKGKIHDIDLAYITGRGKWYFRSWKGDVTKSGGVATNIGIHFFDMLIDIFGGVQENMVHYTDEKTASGFLLLERARVKWFLSVDASFIPPNSRRSEQRTFRSISIDGEEVEFSDGFADLHTESYKRILQGQGFTAEDARPSIEAAYSIRNAKPAGIKGEYHPFLNKIKVT